MKENNARESGEFQIRFLVHTLPLVHPQKKKSCCSCISTIETRETTLRHLRDFDENNENKNKNNNR